MSGPKSGSFGALLAVLVIGCAQPATQRPTGAFALRTGDRAHLSLGPQGGVVGPALQLSSTPTGYRGIAGTKGVDLRSDGNRIVGSIQSRVVDLRLSMRGDVMVVSGLFGGRLGRFEASNFEIRSALGVCAYQLTAVDTRYEGERSCTQVTFSESLPSDLKLPLGFERLSIDRQAMLLALLLSM